MKLNKTVVHRAYNRTWHNRRQACHMMSTWLGLLEQMTRKETANMWTG